jgi:predicted aspartyl protease
MCWPTSRSRSITTEIMTTDSAREVVEQFTFRHGPRSVTTEAVIDTGSETTHITLDITAALGLDIIRQIDLRLADGSVTVGRLHMCVVAWTIYEHQGYHSYQEVVCSPGTTPLIGLDFLRKHELSVDTPHWGLVGSAPHNAVPLTGGGYMINPPRGLVEDMNYHRFQAAKPGEVLRPHPFWRFRLPAGYKVKPDGH